MFLVDEEGLSALEGVPARQHRTLLRRSVDPHPVLAPGVLEHPAAEDAPEPSVQRRHPLVGEGQAENVRPGPRRRAPQPDLGVAGEGKALRGLLRTITGYRRHQLRQ